MWGFAGSAAEREFQLHYATSTAPIGLIACAIGLFTQLLKLAKALLHALAGHAVSVHTPIQVWLRALMFLALLCIRWVFGRNAYILYRGVHCAWVQLLFAFGVVAVFRPEVGCRYCGMLWRHRLLLVNVSAVVSLAPVECFWLTGLSCWLIAAIVEAADPTVACGHSLSCLLTAIAAKAAKPWSFLQATFATASSRHVAFLLDVVLPGLLLMWLEHRARTAWQLRRLQQQDQQSLPNPGSLQAATVSQKPTQEAKLLHEEVQHDVPTGTTHWPCSSKTAAAETPGSIQQSWHRHRSSPASNSSKQSSTAPAPPSSTATGSQAATAVTAEPPAASTSSNPSCATSAVAGSLTVQDCPRTTALMTAQAVAGFAAAADPARLMTAPAPGSPGGPEASESETAVPEAPQATTDVAQSAASAAHTARAAVAGCPVGPSAMPTAAVASPGAARQLAGQQTNPNPFAAEATSPYHRRYSAPPLRSANTSAVQAPTSATVAATESVADSNICTTSSSAVNALPASLPASVQPSAVATHPNQHQPHQRKRATSLYCSPLNWHFLSVKLTQAPGPAVLQTFEQQTTAAVQAATQEALQSSTSLHAASPSSSHRAPVAIRVAAFPGCYQILMQLSVPSCLPQDELLTYLQHLEQHINRQVQQMLTAWPDVKLISISLARPAVQFQEQTHQQQELQLTTASSDISHHADATYGVEALDTVHNSQHDAASSSVRVTAADTYMQPVAIALHHDSCPQYHMQQMSTAADANTGNTCVCAQLFVSQAAQIRLLSCGVSAVRIVVSPQQFGGQSLLDDTWQLQGKQSTADQAEDANAGHAEASTAASAARQDVCLPLNILLPISNSSTQEQQDSYVHVLNIVVLRHYGAAAATAEHAPAVAVDVSSNSSSVHQLDTEAQVDAAVGVPTAALHGVIATLPLLVLPPGVAHELQQLFDQLVKDGLTSSAAYQEMLPVLQDFAVLLSSQVSTSSAHEVRHDSVAVLQDALLAFCTEYDLQESKLLLERVQCSTAAPAASQGLADDSPNSARCVERTAATEAAWITAGGGVVALPALRDGTATLSTPKSGEDAKRCVEEGSISSSSPSGSVCKHSSANKRSVTNSKEAANDAGSSTSPTGAAALQRSNALQDVRAAADAPETLQISVTTLLFGFPATLEAAYLAYKVAFLKRHDFGALLLYILGEMIALSKLLLLIRRNAVAVQVYVAALRAAFIAVHIPACCLLWLATAHPQRFGILQQWRSILLYNSAILITCIAAACMHAGGDLAKATVAVAQGAESGWWPIISMRHIIHPALVCAVVAPDTACYLFLQVLILDPLMCALFGLPRPEVQGFGVRCTAVVLMFLHMTVAAVLEFLMRRSFVRHVLANRAQARHVQ